jgi:hypothetical protein
MRGTSGRDAADVPRDEIRHDGHLSVGALIRGRRWVFETRSLLG